VRLTRLPLVFCLTTSALAVNCDGSPDRPQPSSGATTGGVSSTSAGSAVLGGASSVGGGASTQSPATGGSAIGGSSLITGGTSSANTTTHSTSSGGSGQGGHPGSGGSASGAVDTGGTTLGGAGGGSAGSAGRGGSAGSAGGSGGPRVGCTQPARYRNLFVELLGKSSQEVDAKLNALVQQLFHGTDDQKIYYEMASDKAQIYDIASGDVRSEGQSYGMMIAVQMDMRTEFDKLWNYAAGCMRQANGTFTWSMQQGSCSAKQQGFAPDGEEYFAMALILASRRWDTSTGIDYAAEAKKVLKTLATQDEFSQDPACVFYTQNSGNSDPSYVLPLFYSEWACFDPEYGALWEAATTHARQPFFRNACHKQTGLAPERSALDGTPQDEFGPDSWHVPMNIMMDFNLNQADTDWQASYAKTHAAFWIKEGLTSYGDRYSLSGEKKNSNHGPGQDGVNAMLAFALAPDDANAKALLQRAWDVPMQTGQYRYYNGCLQVLSFLHTSGRFRLFF